jgi:hypothetical protein
MGRFMILGMSVGAFTLLHVIMSTKIGSRVGDTAINEEFVHVYQTKIKPH